MASMLVGTIGIQWSRWYLAHPKVFTVAAVIPMFPHIGLYRNDFGGKISQLGYSEPLMITLLTNFLTASSIVGALSIGLSIPDYGCTASALAYKIASLKHTDERQPPLLRVLL